MPSTSPQQPDDAELHQVEPAPETEPSSESPSVATTPELSPAAAAARLKQLFPALFGGSPKPLKLRIQVDIQERAPGVFSKQVLSAFFRRYTGSTSYLLAVAKGSHRYDLDGQAVAELTDEHRKVAADELTRRRSLNEDRRALDDQKRYNRACLLRDFQTTTLTPANFAALKGIPAEDLDGILATAREEAAQQPAQAPQAPRGDRPRRPGGPAGRPEGAGRQPGGEGRRR
ncbi:MAG: ProQ/FinO family protein [Pseudomonadota bacterium]